MRPKPEAETDGSDDGKFHSAHPRGGNIDLRQSVEMMWAVVAFRPKVWCTAPIIHAMSRFIALSLQVYIHQGEERNGLHFKAKLNGSLR